VFQIRFVYILSVYIRVIRGKISIVKLKIFLCELRGLCETTPRSTIRRDLSQRHRGHGRRERKMKARRQRS